MNLENTLVDETSRTQWPQVVGFHLYGKYTKSKSTETKSR
jgi:aconitase A